MQNSEKKADGPQDLARPNPGGGDSSLTTGELPAPVPVSPTDRRDLPAPGKNRANCVPRRNCGRAKLASKLQDGFAPQVGRLAANRKALKTERKRKPNHLSTAALGVAPQAEGEKSGGAPGNGSSRAGAGPSMEGDPSSCWVRCPGKMLPAFLTFTSTAPPNCPAPIRVPRRAPLWTTKASRTSIRN